MAETFGYKPALLRKRIDLVLDGTVLTLPGKGGWSVDLTNVTEVRYVSMRVTGTISQYLVLGNDSGRHRLGQNLTIVEQNGPRDQEFRTSVSAVLDRLAHTSSGRPVTIGPAGAMGWAMFIICVLTLLAGLGLGGLVVATGALDRRGPEGLIYVVGMVALGGFFSWRYRPGQRPVTMPAGQLAQALRDGSV